MTAHIKMSPKPVLHSLTCPYCALGIEIQDHEFVDGTAVLCLHCFEEPILTRERNEPSAREQWRLVAPFRKQAA